MPIVITGILIVLGLTALLWVSQSSAVATLGYDLKRLEVERAREVARSEQLLIEIGQLESLPRLEEAATRLGLVPPERVVFVRVPADTVPTRQAVLPTAASRDPALAGTRQLDLIAQISLLVRPVLRGVGTMVGLTQP
jgi:hypothetical protein